MSGSVLLYPNMSNFFVPVAYFEQSGAINDYLASQWQQSVGLALQIKQYGPIGLFACVLYCFTINTTQ